MRRCVWSRNLVNEESTAHVGPQRHKKKILSQRNDGVNLIQAEAVIMQKLSVSEAILFD